MIEVTVNYGGEATGGARIVPGVYQDGDAALFGLADFLVQTGRARVIVVAAPDAETEPAQAPKPAPRKSKGGA